MDNLQNLHTHSTYCDGKHTLEEMVNYAVKKGFSSLGFSGHSYMFFSESYSMSLSGTEEYKKEVSYLKEKYKGKIDIFCGLEFEKYSKVELKDYDYIIASSHYFKIGDSYVGFDRSKDEVKRVIDTYFEGSGISFAKAYYSEVAELPSYGKFDILGHFDLAAKTVEQGHFFDIESREYLDAAITAIDAVSGKIPFFEVNTGAISRGYRHLPYPSITLMKEFKKRGFGAVISSDCHDGEHLDTGFFLARELLTESGFTEKYILTESGFKAVSL